ncbi:MAG: hypothetical protein KJO60_12245, partial [Desulfofustis sp.]|nr:hypothetical protein [Desulfofustis sp.]
AATDNDVIVTSNLGINTISVCEHVLAMMRAPVKRLPRELHLVIGNLNSAVSGSYGVAGVKYASEVAGFRGGDPRLPLLPLQDSDKESIRRAIEATDFSTYI